MTQPLPSASTAAQQKSYVTYTAPAPSPKAPRITLLESPSLLASSGTTGFRTWEAALFLGAYLASFGGNHFITNRNVIELGAGTGFLSILCAKHLGAKIVLATDGSREVVTDLKTNLDLNKLDEGGLFRTAVLQWGHTLINSVADCRDANAVFDLAIGADVTYDLNSIPPLIATIQDLFELYPSLQVIISATVRNRETLDSFITACSRSSFSCKRMDVPLSEHRDQIGFFIPSITPIHILLITRIGPASDPFEI